MAIRRPTKPLNVTREEKEKLEMLARRPKSTQAIASVHALCWPVPKE